MTITKPTRLDGLQVLRFIAAFLVLSGHLVHEGVAFHLLPDWVEPAFSWVPWYAGVDIFFVISGFIMFHVSAPKFGQPGAQKHFLLRRIARLVPLYWFFSLLMLLAIVLVPSRLAHDALDARHVIASFLFIPWPNTQSVVQPILALGWTLNYEMFFYLVFSFALVLSGRTGIICVAALFIALSAIHPLMDANWVQLSFWTNPIILEFVGGMGVAYWLQRQPQLPQAGPAILMALGAVLFFAMPFLPLWGDYGRALGFGTSGALIVAGLATSGFSARSRFGRWVVLAGDASYALYLSHPFSVNIVAFLIGALGIGANWLFVPLGLVAAIGISIAVYLVAERPLTNKLNATLKARALSVTTAPVLKRSQS